MGGKGRAELRRPVQSQRLGRVLQHLPPVIGAALE